MSETATKRLGFFERWLTIWVAAGMVVGVLFEKLLPGATDMLRGLILEHLWES